MELGMISSTWLDTKVGRLEGIRTAKEIGFDTYDIFEDPLDLTDAERAEIKATCEEVGLPIRSVVCVAFGLVDFNPSVQRFTLDRIKAYVDQGAFLGARNVLLVVGEYYWDGEVFPREAIWDMAKDAGQGGRRVRAVEGPRDRARARAVRRGAAQGRRRARSLRQGDRPPGGPRERRHLAPPPLERVLRRRREADRADRAHPPLRLRRQGARRHAGRDGRDADQGVPGGDPRHGLRRHRLDRARVLARSRQDRRVDAAGLRRHGRDHARPRRPRRRSERWPTSTCNTGPEPPAEDRLRDRLHRRRLHHEGHPPRRLRRGRLRRRRDRVADAGARACRGRASTASGRSTTRGRSCSTTSASRSSTSRSRPTSSSRSSARRSSGRTSRASSPRSRSRSRSTRQSRWCASATRPA